MTGSLFLANRFLSHYLDFESGYTRVFLAFIDIFSFTSNSFLFFLASNGVIVVTELTNLLLYVNNFI